MHPTIAPISIGPPSKMPDDALRKNARYIMMAIARGSDHGAGNRSLRLLMPGQLQFQQIHQVLTLLVGLLSADKSNCNGTSSPEPLLGTKPEHNSYNHRSAEEAGWGRIMNANIYGSSEWRKR